MKKDRNFWWPSQLEDTSTSILSVADASTSLPRLRPKEWQLQMLYPSLSTSPLWNSSVQLKNNKSRSHLLRLALVERRMDLWRYLKESLHTLSTFQQWLIEWDYQRRSFLDLVVLNKESILHKTKRCWWILTLLKARFLQGDDHLLLPSTWLLAPRIFTFQNLLPQLKEGAASKLPIQKLGQLFMSQMEWSRNSQGNKDESLAHELSQ